MWGTIHGTVYPIDENEPGRRVKYTRIVDDGLAPLQFADTY